MVKTQFSYNIKVYYTDNAIEYTNSRVINFLS